MQALEFEKITSNMNVLYKKDNKIYATTVISTSLGHPSTRSVRLKGGFIYYYDIAYLPEHHVKNLNELIYADNDLRPLALRLAKIRRPPTVACLDLKP